VSDSNLTVDLAVYSEVAARTRAYASGAVGW